METMRIFFIWRMAHLRIVIADWRLTVHGTSKVDSIMNETSDAVLVHRQEVVDALVVLRNRPVGLDKLEEEPPRLLWIDFQIMVYIPGHIIS